MPVSLLTSDYVVASGGTTLTIDCTGAGIIVAKAAHGDSTSDTFPTPTIDGVAMTELLVNNGYRSSHGVWYKQAPAQGNVSVVFPANPGGDDELVVEAYSGDTVSDAQYVNTVTTSQTLTCANFTPNEDLVSGLTNAAYAASAGTGVTFHAFGVSGIRFSAGTRTDGADYNVTWPTAYEIGMTIFRVSSSGPQAIRKGSQFTVEETLAGTVVSATLNGNAITVDSHVGTTVTLTDSGSGITTSGEYPLVLTDDSATPQTQTITLQVNVYGVAPSNNPLQKDGSALASLTGVQLRVTSGANINGTELYYSGTATTDASGNLSNIDLSSTAAADADPVLLHMRTAAGDSIIASETVGLI